MLCACVVHACGIYGVVEFGVLFCVRVGRDVVCVSVDWRDAM